MAAHFTEDQRSLARRLRAHGASLRDICKQISCSSPSHVQVVLKGQIRLGRTNPWTPRPGRLTMDDRQAISFGLGSGASMSSITRQIGRSPSTVTREVKSNGGRDDYRIWRSHQRARECAKRPKPTKLEESVLCAKVTEWLEEFWSPKEIARRLVLDFPDDPSMRISHETIYQSLFVQGRGELRRELARCLRSGRTKRRPQGSTKHRGVVRDMVMISDRPAEIEDRAVPGHWEGDLIVGANHHSAV